jgi:hypothetical protein
MLESRPAMNMPTVVTVSTTHLYSKGNQNKLNGLHLYGPYFLSTRISQKQILDALVDVMSYLYEDKEKRERMNKFS